MSGSGLRATLRLRRGRFLLRAELEVPPGVTVLFGPSGAGKSTTLEALAGHLRPEAGRIVLGGRVLFDAAAGVEVPPRARRIGYVAQQGALFPHLSAAQNLSYGLFALAPPARRRRVEEVAEQLGLTALLSRRPDELSGGERQRVQLGRALAPRPEALLLDEPLSAVDGPARRELLRLLHALSGLGVPVLHVTHDLSEAELSAHALLRLRPASDGATEVVAEATRPSGWSES